MLCGYRFWGWWGVVSGCISLVVVLVQVFVCVCVDARMRVCVLTLAHGYFIYCLFGAHFIQIIICSFHQYHYHFYDKCCYNKLDKLVL